MLPQTKQLKDAIKATGYMGKIKVIHDTKKEKYYTPDGRAFHATLHIDSCATVRLTAEQANMFTGRITMVSDRFVERGDGFNFDGLALFICRQ